VLTPSELVTFSFSQHLVGTIQIGPVMGTRQSAQLLVLRK